MAEKTENKRKKWPGLAQLLRTKAGINTFGMLLQALLFYFRIHYDSEKIYFWLATLRPSLC